MGIIEKYKVIQAFEPKTTNAAITSDYVTLKNSITATVVVNLAQTAGHETQISLYQAQDVEGTGAKSLGSVRSSIESGINSALSYLASLPSKAWSYGADFVNGIVNGIRSAAGKVQDAVSALAAKIRSYLHFSVPDEGPLTDYESWMPDFMSGLAEGINKSKSVVIEAVRGLSLDMKVNTKMGAVAVPDNSNSKDKTQSNNNFTLHIENFINNTDKDIEQLAYELEFYRRKISMGKGGI